MRNQEGKLGLKLPSLFWNKYFNVYIQLDNLFFSHFAAIEMKFYYRDNSLAVEITKNITLKLNVLHCHLWLENSYGSLDNLYKVVNQMKNSESETIADDPNS